MVACTRVVQACPVKQYPFSAIGQLQMRNSAGNFICSAALIAPDAVLTTAHCVFARDNKGGGVSGWLAG